MNVKVTKTNVLINTDYILNDKEYNINKCTFDFSEEYTRDLVKKAIFIQGNNKIEMAILNNECKIPQEVLNKGNFELHVYAYEVDGDDLLVRYSPTFVNVYVREGSYVDGASGSEEITPTQFEQYMQAMNDGLNEVANVNIDASKERNVATISITNRYGETKNVNVYDGDSGITVFKIENGHLIATSESGSNLTNYSLVNGHLMLTVGE